MPMHPQVLAMREQRRRDKVPQLYTLSVQEARDLDLKSIQDAGGVPEEVASVTEQVIEGPGGKLPLRIYRPVLDSALPALVYFFGGGWTLGNLDTCDAVCRRIANLTGCAVVSAEYRLAPEHKFPAAVHDCYAATIWASSHVDAPCIAVGGDSAGGNLAAAVALLARDEGVPLAAQLLVYPCTDYLSDTPSLREGDDPLMFNKTSVAWYWENYLASPADGLNPLASPLRASSLDGLPPTLVITAEYDPLRDQAEQYATRLAAAGVPVKLSRYDGMVHGFFCMAGDLDAGAAAQAEAANFIASHLQPHDHG
jgi:acetyl esterase/lipase